jgi:two-component system cell cycle sensor histidine kinase PleC
LKAPRKLPNIIVDRNRLRQVLQNIIINALKYSPNPDVIILTLSVEDKLLKFSIIDHGKGMDTDTLNLAFQPYIVGKYRSKTGLGLGLPLSKMFIELHGGQIFISSNVGKGTTISFTLPVVDEYAVSSNGN